MKSALFLLLLGMNASISVITSGILLWISFQTRGDGSRRLETIAAWAWSTVICAVPAWMIWIVLNFKK